MQVINEGKKESLNVLLLRHLRLLARWRANFLAPPQVVPFELSPTVMLQKLVSSLLARLVSYLVLYSSLSPFKKPISSAYLRKKFPFRKKIFKEELGEEEKSVAGFEPRNHA